MGHHVTGSDVNSKFKHQYPKTCQTSNLKPEGKLQTDDRALSNGVKRYGVWSCWKQTKITHGDGLQVVEGHVGTLRRNDTITETRKKDELSSRDRPVLMWQ